MKVPVIAHSAGQIVYRKNLISAHALLIFQVFVLYALSVIQTHTYIAIMLIRLYQNITSISKLDYSSQLIDGVNMICTSQIYDGFVNNRALDETRNQ